MPDDDPEAIGRYEWERWVRRCRMNHSTKLVALTISTYANANGTSMYPGVAKLAAVTGLTEKTVRVALASLRDDLGLLRRVRDGRRNGRRALADEYELRRPMDLAKRTHLLDPDESPETITCDQTCGHAGTPVTTTGDRAGSGEEHRYSVPGSPVMSSGSPVMSSPNTGTDYPPPDHDHAKYQINDQREDQLSDASTESTADHYERIGASL